MTKFSTKINNLISESSNEDKSWAPKTLDHLLDEIESIKEISLSEDSLLLYRGQTNILWPLESTFLRNSIPTLFNLSNYYNLPRSIRNRSTFHRSIASLLLLKFDQIIKPSEEAYQKEQTHGIDPYFELLKNVQQYPEKYEEVNFIKGTNLIDWTHVFHIALYFCSIDGVGQDRNVNFSPGVLYLFNASATGKIHQTIKTQQLFDNMTSYEFLNGEAGMPLMLHPQKQTNQLRASNQKPVYIAQMNFSYSLTDVWEQYEIDNSKKVYLKIRIDEPIKKEIYKYLEENDITEEHVYPH